MRILIISTFFPPQNSIASHRPYSWAKYWAMEGHDVTVLTTRKQQLPSDLNLDTSLFTILELPVRIPFSKLNTIVRNSEYCKPERLYLTAQLLSIVKKVYLYFCNKTGVFYSCRYPDWHDFWAEDAVVLLKKDPVQWDFVISSGWPYSTHRVGLFLKENNLTKTWIVDWRDLWTSNHLYKGLAIFHHYERNLEKRFHKNADFITTVSDGLAEQLKQITTTPVKVIYNGFDPDDFEFLFSKERKVNRKFTIAYLGTFYRGYQDPTPLFVAIKELQEEGLVTSDQIEILFAGPNADVSDIVKDNGVEDFYSYKGFLPREKALEIQYDADAVLFLEFRRPGVKGILTGKLFEYLYVAREIWAIGTTPETSAGELIIKANAGRCLGRNIELIKETIVGIKNGNHNQKNRNRQVINEYQRGKQAKRILDAFDTSDYCLKKE